MPYIKQEARPGIDGAVTYLAQQIKITKDAHGIDEGAALNYFICALYRKLSPQTYPEMAKLLSGLDMAKMEIYRRCMARYEDAKLVQNGDVFFL